MVFVDGLVDRVLQVRPRAEPAGVHFSHVDFGLAVDHPLGEVLPSARPLGDADRRASAEPVVVVPGGRAHEVAAIRSVGDGAADHLLDAGLGEHRESLGRHLQPRGQLVEVGRGEVEVEVPVDSFEPVGDGVACLVGADEQAVDLTPVVARRAGVADDGHLDLTGLHGVQRFGDQVLVDHRDDRDVDARHGTNLRGVVAGRVDDVVAGDLALVGGDPPAAVGQLGHPGDQGMTGDLSAQLAGPGGHSVGGAGGVGPAVRRGPEAEYDVVDRLHEGGLLADVLVADEMGLDADLVEHALDVPIPLGLLVVDGQADGSAAVPAGGHSGLGLELGVELGAVGVDLGHVEAADEVGDEAGSVPGGPGGELTLLNK